MSSNCPTCGGRVGFGQMLPMNNQPRPPDEMGYCCYGGNKTRKHCGDCIAWRPVSLPSPSCVSVPRELSDDEIMSLVEPGMVNPHGSIYSHRIVDFARALLQRAGGG